MIWYIQFTHCRLINVECAFEVCGFASTILFSNVLTHRLQICKNYLGTILEPLLVLRDGFQMHSEVNAHIHFRCTLKIKYPLLYCSCVNNSIFYQFHLFGNSSKIVPIGVVSVGVLCLQTTLFHTSGVTQYNSILTKKIKPVSWLNRSCQELIIH